MAFHQNYLYLTDQLPPSLIQESWRRLTTKKRNPLTEIEAGNINLVIENFLKHEVERYNQKKERQRQYTKIRDDSNGIDHFIPLESAKLTHQSTASSIEQDRQSPISSEISCVENTELHSSHTLQTHTKYLKKLRQDLISKINKENVLYLKNEREKLTNENVKYLETERKRLQFEYDCHFKEFSDASYKLKQKFEDRYKSKVSAMETQFYSTTNEYDKKIIDLTSSINRYKEDMQSLKKTNKATLEKINKLENKCRQLEDVVSAKDQKIISLNDKIISYYPRGWSDGSIEPEIYYSTYDQDLWSKWRSDTKYDPEIRKKYTFRKHL